MTRELRERDSSRQREADYFRDEAERYRQAAEDALQQVDWCIGYFHGTGKQGVARSLSKNRSYIRRNLLNRAEQPDPSGDADEQGHER